MIFIMKKTSTFPIKLFSDSFWQSSASLKLMLVYNPNTSIGMLVYANAAMMTHSARYEFFMKKTSAFPLISTDTTLAFFTQCAWL